MALTFFKGGATTGFRGGGPDLLTAAIAAAVAKGAADASAEIATISAAFTALTVDSLTVLVNTTNITSKNALRRSMDALFMGLNETLS